MAATYPFPGLADTSVDKTGQPRNFLSLTGFRRKASTLLLRMALLNLLAFGLLAAAWWEGLVNTVLEADKTYLTVLIFLVFTVGLVISVWRAIQINREIDQFLPDTKQQSETDDGFMTQKHYAESLGNGAIGALRMRLAHRIAAVRHIANVLVLLGLIGTVLGFIIALSGVNPETASDIEGIAPMVSTLIQGMSTALYTTLVGSILNVWLSANYQMLASGTVELMSRWMEWSEHTKADKPKTDYA
ncbi:MAG: MotA/TolQ/ExbB proton channel family protein [Granulosicoccus sp.]|nr:MotA/TolQ/ExbB proton channel family protein [Granulosicoccus sp.]